MLVTKPFSLATTLTRLHAMLRGADGEILAYADLVLDEGSHEVRRGEQQIVLTATEFNLLRYFMLNPRRVLSRGQILANVWQHEGNGRSTIVETYVSYLRRKLDAAGPPLIRTVREVGYMLDARAER
jgi:two-component system OmpR family response regulator